MVASSSHSELDSSWGSAVDPTVQEKPGEIYRDYIKGIGQRLAVIYVTLAATYACLYTFPYT